MVIEVLEKVQHLKKYILFIWWGYTWKYQK